MSISVMSKIKSTVWLNFLSPDFVFACLIASIIVLLSRGIFKPRANEGLETHYKNIRLSLFVTKQLFVVSVVDVFLDFPRIFTFNSDA